MTKHPWPGFRLVMVSLAALFAIAALGACGNITHGKEIASDAMDTFHDRFNAGEFDKIYDTADPDFQTAMTRADFLKLEAAVHRKLGDYKNCAVQDWSMNTFNSDTSVTLRYKTAFAQGTGDEVFVYRVAGSRATLRSYHINSNRLIEE